jgi:hypothetical protein
MPIEDENHHNSNQVYYSYGRTRQDLNKADAIGTQLRNVR